MAETAFEITPKEAWALAQDVIRWCKSKRMTVSVETALNDDIPLRTTVLGRDSGLPILIEVQHHAGYGRSVSDAALALAARREYAELYLAVPVDATLSGAVLQRLRKDGVGVMFVRGGVLDIHSRARNYALCVNADPTLQLGAKKTAVEKLIKRFNDGDRKDALRDMCELFEETVTALAFKAARKQVLTKSEQDIAGMNLATKINVLAGGNNYPVGTRSLVGEDLKDDLHSFRTARNLVDHSVRGRRAEIARQRQYLDRMVMAPRLIGEIASISRRVR